MPYKEMYLAEYAWNRRVPEKKVETGEGRTNGTEMQRGRDSVRVEVLRKLRVEPKRRKDKKGAYPQRDAGAGQERAGTAGAQKLRRM
ncbi:hypothetical protein [uncultured Dysosmobacter sp.]|uniref:hypothetical protein n=1 Tax=uncultured Dysosmobacter sp. TaxID=2591384 RepID=UPI00260FE575|nr:hypothetical protein [uncultured Dysosmobacter sp.]